MKEDSMKKALFAFTTVSAICLFLVVGTGIARQGGQLAGSAYDPAVHYSGAYAPDLLFVRNSPNDTNWRRIPPLDLLTKVTCADALESLKREGKWKGHLKIDGSCGSTAEPAEWALGNRLNYDEEQGQGVR